MMNNLFKKYRYKLKTDQFTCTAQNSGCQMEMRRIMRKQLRNRGDEEVDLACPCIKDVI